MKRVFAVLLVFIIVVPSFAWNYTGHKAIGIIAYGLLTPTTKARVDSLLSRHPDYPKWTAGIAAADKGRAAFLEAAIWPDEIRNNPRFHNDNQRPTPDIPGLPLGLSGASFLLALHEHSVLNGRNNDATDGRAEHPHEAEGL